MGLWLKQDDGSLIPLGGSGSSGGSGSGGGPHDHDEFALVEHDHDEFTHDHAEYAPVEHDHDEFTHDHAYLPLTGGTLAGDLAVNGQINVGADFSVKGIDVKAGYVRHADGDYSWPSISFQTDMQAGFYLAAPQKVGVRQNLQVDGDLAVTGKLDVANELTVSHMPGDDTASLVMDSGRDGGYVSFTCNRDSGFGLPQVQESEALKIVVGSDVRMVLRADRYTKIWGDADVSEGLVVGTDLWAKGKITHGPTKTPVGVFVVADRIDTRDVLERAETATMPAPDEEGVAATDADGEGLTVNEVVTALLLKLKELSARIEELEGN